MICRKVLGTATWATWDVILSTDEDCQLVEVLLNDESLEHDKHECRVPSLKGRLTVLCRDGQQHDIPLFNSDPIIFRMQKHWAGEGRRTKTSRIPNGHFIVIAPVTWKRTGRGPVEPAGCADTKFRAHYFHRDATMMDDGGDGFREWKLPPDIIKLTGRRVFDDSGEGALFTGCAPRLNLPADIVWARVGEEATNGWRQNFRPEEQQSLQEVLAGREGRFFLRVYDSPTGPLVDSVAFRYLSNLSQILVNGVQYAQDTALVPKSTGYPPTEVRFVRAAGELISPILPAGALHTIEETSGVLMVPPRPDADRISCELESEKGSANIVLDLDRIWWRLENDHSDPGEWCAKSLVMTREEFRKHADANMTMSLRSKRKEVHVGFDDEPGLPYRRTAEEDHISIPLYHFVDYDQIDRRLDADAHFNLEWAEQKLPLIRILADPMPEIISFIAESPTITAGEESILKWATRNSDDAQIAITPGVGEVERDGIRSVHPSKTTTYTLTLTVSGTHNIRRSITVAVEPPPGSGAPKPRKLLRPLIMSTRARGGWRVGKGFSLRELHEASLTVSEAADRFIPIDRRRDTSHRANVERIRSMLNV